MEQPSLFDWTPNAERSCDRCGKVFEPIRRSQKFCGRRCQRATQARRDYWKNVEQRRAYSRAERRRNRDKWREYQRGYSAANREKLTQAARAHREKNRDRYLDCYLQRAYGITLAEYNRILADQGGGCGICGAVESRSRGQGVRLHVDHDHASGKVRGLLCDTCNRGIGQLGDDPERVRAAVRYLERTRLDFIAPTDERDTDAAVMVN